MANIKITDLTAYTNPDTTDVLPIVDVGADVTKKVSVEALLKNAGDGTVGAPSIAFDSDQDTGIYKAGTNSIGVATAGASRIVIDHSGNVTVTGATTFDSNVVIDGNLTVNGTTTTVSSETLLVEDKNIEMGVVDTPTDTTANGGGITLKGTTDKTLNWLDATDSWTSSENVDLASGKSYRINNTEVLNSTTLGSGVTGSSLTSVGTISSGTWQGTAIDDAYLDTISTAGKVSNSATTATSANTASAIVARDGTGNFSAGTITAALTGNADTATALSSNRTFAVTGDVTGTVSSDLTAGASIATSIAAGVIVNDDINASAAIADTKLDTISTAGKVSNSATTATNANTANAIVARDASGDFSAGTVTADLTGNADTATALSSNRTFAVTGDVTGTVSSDLTSGASIATSIASGVIVNDDVNASAAIAGTKIAPDFGSQTIQTTGVINAGSGTAAAPSVSVGTTDNGLYSPGTDQVALSTNGTGRLFVNASGNVGIGTSSPSSLLQITGSGDGANYLVVNANSTGSETLEVGVPSGGGNIQLTATHGGGGSNSAGFIFRTRNGLSGTAERLRITSAGLVGIGTSVPGAKLHISDNSGGGSGLFIHNTNGSTNSSADLWFGNWSGATTGTPQARLQAINKNVNTAATDLAFHLYDGNSTSERMRIDSSGRVGIGSNVPPYRLTVKDTADQIHITNPTAGDANSDGFTIGLSGSDAQLINRENGSIILYQNSGEAARIDSSKRLLVGTSSTSASVSSVMQGNSSGAAFGGTLLLARGQSAIADGAAIGFLDFSDSGHVASAQISAARDGGTWTSGSSQPTRLEFYTTADGASSPTERMRIQNPGLTIVRSEGNALYATTNDAAGTSTRPFIVGHSATGMGQFTASMHVYSNGNVQNTNNSYGGISDIKLKENIADANSQWNDIKALRVRNYNFKEGQTHTQIGLIAQEVELVSPGLVSESPDRDEDGNDLGTVTKSVNYSVLYMKAVKALQEAMERIETLEAKVAALESA